MLTQLRIKRFYYEVEAIVFMFCFTLHNIEEALWLTSWRNEHIPNRKTPDKKHFVFAAMGITLLGYLTAGLYLLFPGNPWLEYAFIGFVGAMLINALIPHLLLTIIYRSFCPGVFTGCFLIMPFHIIFICNAVNESFSVIEVIVATCIVGPLLLIFIPIFQSIARRYFNA